MSFAIRYPSFTEVPDFCRNFLRSWDILRCCHHNATSCPCNSHSSHWPDNHTGCIPEFTKFHLTHGWAQSHWNMSVFQTISLNLRTSTSRLAEADPCPYSQWYLWRQICWRFFAGRLYCPFCRQVRSRRFGLKKTQCRSDCLCGWIYFKWWQTELGREKEWSLF